MEVPRRCGECDSFLLEPTDMNPYGGSCLYWSMQQERGIKNGFTRTSAFMSACTQGRLCAPERVVMRRAKAPQDVTHEAKRAFAKLGPIARAELIAQLREEFTT
jgi:hypothetical protein